METHQNEFLKAHKKVRSGKKFLSDKDFIKFRSKKPDNLNSLGKFFFDKRVSIDELQKIASEYNSRCYKLEKYICVILPKGKDDFRPLLVPHPRDRILFSFILEKIKPDLLPVINNYRVFGSGKRIDYKNMKKILAAVHEESKKHKFILKIDISKFFPSIKKELLIDKLKDYIKDEYILELIKNSFQNEIEIKFTKSFSDEKKKEISEFVKKGVPQGCAYSPLVANLYALDMDKLIKSENLVSFRYLDDMIIFTESKEQCEEVFKKLKEIALNTLGLRIHDIDKKTKDKTYIQQANHTFEYLGIEIKSDGSFEIPINKIRKEINLIKTGIFNKQTIKKFSAKNVVDVLESQLKGWRMFYQKNFPTSYDKLKTLTHYNEELKSYYKGILYNNRKLKKELSETGFDLQNNSYYLF